MKRRAFTLVELLAVIAIIGLLSTVAVVNYNNMLITARDNQRKANLTQLYKALELYYADNGAYPSTGGAVWAECSAGGNFAVKGNSGPNGWVPNLAPTYMAVLPHDPHTNMVNPRSARSECQTIASWNCYWYRSDGVDYKLAAQCTPEGPMLQTDPFADPAPWGGTGRWVYRWAIYTQGAANSQ